MRQRPLLVETSAKPGQAPYRDRDSGSETGYGQSY